MANVHRDIADGTWDARYGHLRALDAYDVGCIGDQHAGVGALGTLRSARSRSAPGITSLVAGTLVLATLEVETVGSGRAGPRGADSEG